MVQRILERGEIESLDHTTIPRQRLPVAVAVFEQRASRLRDLAAGKVPGIPVNPTLSGYLVLMRELVLAQAELAKTLNVADVAMPDAQTLDLAIQHMMPPLSIQAARPPIWRDILNKLITRLDTGSNPQLTAVLDSLRAMSDAELEAQADAVLAQDRQVVNPAQAPFIAAALQVLWTSRAGQLNLQQIPMLETFTLCPVCGSHPVASVVRIGGQSQGYRYLVCSMCASEWHMVRVKCACCEHNGKIAYHGLDAVDTDNPISQQSSAPDNKANDPRKFARAETCDDCHSYTKILNQEHDYNVEPLVDDMASLTLDVLVGEAGYARGSINPLLWFGAAP